jgi:RNA recognition motif-containing protein
MDHLMAINEPFHQRDTSHNSNFSSMDSYAVKDTSMRAPGANDVYVGHIPNEVDSNSLAHFFSQFGEIDRIFEGKKIPPGGMKWAFISYIHPEDSYRYNPTFSLNNF